MNMAERLSQWERLLEEGLNSSDPAAEPAWVIRCYEETGSTMDEARRLCAELKAQRSGLVMARLQTQGRGRQGRVWQPAPGALAATFVFPISRELCEVSCFTLIAGCVLCDFFRALSCQVGLKWPNDVVTSDGRKLGGILSETAEANGARFALVGIGANLTATPPGLTSAAAVEELCGRVLEAPQAALALGQGLRQAWMDFERRGFGAFRDKWLALAQYMGEEVCYDCAGQMVQGKVMGINEKGALLLLDEAANVREIVSGHMM